MCYETMHLNYDLPWEGFGFCSPMLGMWVFHNKQRRVLELQLQWSGRKARKDAEAHRDNGRAVRVSEMEATAWPVQVQATKDMA